MPFELYASKAEYYAAAFDWPVAHQVGAISGLSGLERGRVLEPMCGNARLLRAFAEAGFQTVGFDISPRLLRIAQSDFGSAGLAGEWLVADAVDFRLNEACDLAVCPVNSLAHLQTVADMAAHLEAVSRNLYSGGYYWLPLDLKAAGDVDQGEAWTFELDGRTLTCEWSIIDHAGDFETHQIRMLEDGRPVFGERHRMRRWTYAAWMRVIDRSPFMLTGAYDGNSFEPFALDESLEGRRVFWQQLVKLH